MGSSGRALVVHVVVVAALAASVGVPAAAGAGGRAGPSPGVVYDSNDEDGSGPEVQDLFLLAPARGDRPGWVRFSTVTDCGAGDVQARIGRDGRLRDRVVVAGDHEDERVTIELTLRGELGPDGGDGTLVARIVDGPRCRDERDWKVVPERDEPGLRRLEAWVPSRPGDADPLLATTDALVLMVEPGVEGRSSVTAVDPATDDEAWRTDVDAKVDDVATTPEGVWLLDGTTGTLHRFDPSTREVAATIELGGPPPDPAPDVPSGQLASTGSTVFATVGDSRTLQRIDGATGQVVVTVPLAGPTANVAAGPAGVYVEQILAPRGEANEPTRDRQRPLRISDGETAERSRLVLLDPTTGAALAETETSALWTLVAGPDALYTSEGVRDIVRRDPRTLAEQVRGDYLTLDLVVAPPGVWLTGYDGGLVAVDAASLVERARVDAIYPSTSDGMVAAFDSVWVSELGGVTRVRAGAADGEGEEP